MTRRYQYKTGNPQRNRIITCMGAFHGRTLATIAAGGNPDYLLGFAPIPDGFDVVPFGDIGAIRQAVSTATAGVLLEPIQGEGGINVPPPGFLREARAVADEFGLVLALDEVQTGMGRTGRLFAHEHDGVVPDIVATAKGLGSGFPVGAVLATAAISSGMTPGSHGTTLGGNPLAMAVVNAVLDLLLEDGFLDTVTRGGAYLKSRLEDVVARNPGLYLEVRGQGLLTGVRCRHSSSEMSEALLKRGMLVAAAANNVVRLLPPLNVTYHEIDEAIEILDRAGAEILVAGKLIA